MQKWSEHDYPEEFDALPKERQALLLDWIDANLIKIQSYNTRHTSYGLKHLVHLKNCDNSYFTNGQFKGAMLKSGFSVKDPNALNWVFNVSQRSPAFHQKK